MAYGDEIRAARRKLGWSYTRLILALSQEAQRQGVGIMSDRSLSTALSRWENNRFTPSRFYTGLLSVVLGLPDAGDIAARTSTYARDLDHAVDDLEVLTRWDHDERPIFTSADGLVNSDQVISGYLFAHSLSFDDLRVPSPSLVAGDSVADQIRAAASNLMSVDFEQGGGHVRAALTDYFRGDVVPELRIDRPAAQRCAVYSAAAEVTQLLGWAAYDSGHHSVAMRYFTLGLRLADEAADHLMGARLLANLSHEFNSLGNYSQALTAARAAQAALRGRGTAAVETMCLMMEARALANLHDERGAALAISHAERIFERSTGSEPEWIGYYDAAELSGDIAHAFRDLGIPARTREFTQTALGPTTPRRTRAFIQLVAADATLASGEVEEAAQLATSALRSGSELQSRRYLQYVQAFCRAVPDLTHPAMAEFMDMVTTRYPRLLRPVDGSKRVRIRSSSR